MPSRQKRQKYAIAHEVLPTGKDALHISVKLLDGDEIALVLVLGQLFWQAAFVDTASQPDCSLKFRSNRWTGWILLAGIVVAHVV